MIHLFPQPGGRRGHRCGPAALSNPSRALCKASAAVAVTEGQLSAREACALCGMDREELEVWKRVVQDHGLRRMLARRI